MGWVTVTRRFEDVNHWAQKYLPCPGCGKKVKRCRTFTQTLNPYNKAADGSLKTERQIMAELQVEANIWREEPEYHERCRP